MTEPRTPAPAACSTERDCRCATHRCPMRWIVWVIAAALFLLHQDCWNWDNASLVLGFIPAGLAYHALFSVFAGGLWLLASRYAWPTDWEAWANEPTADAQSPEQRP